MLEAARTDRLHDASGLDRQRAAQRAPPLPRPDRGLADRPVRALEGVASVSADPEQHRAGWIVTPVTIALVHAPDCPAGFSEADRVHLMSGQSADDLRRWPEIRPDRITLSPGACAFSPWVWDGVARLRGEREARGQAKTRRSQR